MSFEIISEAVDIPDVIPVHPKNWLIDLLVYEIVLFSETKVPVLLNPIVESTVIIDYAMDTVSEGDFVIGVGMKLPKIVAFSSFPINRPILK